MATLTVYATNTGEIGINNATFATAHDASAGSYVATGGCNTACYLRSVDSRYYVQRGFLDFDTSALGAGATITAAILRVFGNGAVVGGQARAYGVYSSTASTPLVVGDFDQIGSTALAPTIAAASWNAAAFNDYSLNATGIAYINKTGVTKFSTREANFDVGNTAPTVANVYVGWTNATAAELVITYTQAMTARPRSPSGGVGIGGAMTF